MLNRKVSKRTVIIVTAVACVILVAGWWIGTSRDRFYLEHNGRITYKVDRRTGQMWMLYGDEERLVKSKPKAQIMSKAPIPPEDQAIALAMEARSLQTFMTNRLAIEAAVKELTGKVLIRGWKAYAVDTENYRVGFYLERDGISLAWLFDTHLSTGIVRAVQADYRTDLSPSGHQTTLSESTP